jgi:GTP-binding protein EngB required for normal cell division
MNNADRETQKWIRNNGMNVVAFNTTHIKLLKAQQIAHQLLNEYKALLTTSQIHTLNSFIKKMNINKIRQKLKPESAHPILNIGTKVKRQLYRQE